MNGNWGFTSYQKNPLRFIFTGARPKVRDLSTQLKASSMTWKCTWFTQTLPMKLIRQPTTNRRLFGCERSFWWGRWEKDKGKSHSFVPRLSIKCINLFKGSDKLFTILWKNPASFRTVMRGGGLSLQCLMCQIFWGNLGWLDLTSNTVDLSQHPVGNSFWIY